MFHRRMKESLCRLLKACTQQPWIAITLAFLAVGGFAQAQSFQDFFTNRETILVASGVLSGDNSNATVELGEPKHGGKTGGHSLWISWVSPSNGVARFKTETSGFDTLLSAYHFASTNDTTFDKLIETARNDDSEELGDRESTIEFGVAAGQRFEIAVDGYFGAVGTIKLTWRLDVTPNPPPTVVSTTSDTTLQIGAPMNLTVVLTNVSGSTKFQWFFNGAELLDEKSTNLVIAAMQVTNVGRYKLQIDVGSHITFFTASTELQINTEGAHALAEPKFPDAPVTALFGSDGVASLLVKPARLAAINAAGVVQGYTGSQIFNTTFATADPTEPIHCNTPGGASYWLAYQPPANGTVTLDTLGSSYDTVMEVYSYNVPPTSYQQLISVACDHGSVPGAARVQFAVIKTRQYVVAVAGVNGARGTAYLNYNLNTNQLPQAPGLTGPPPTLVVTNGADVVLTAPVIGSPPLHFAWAKDTVAMTNSYFPALALSRVSLLSAGFYSVTVTNDLGTVKTTLSLHVVVPSKSDLVQTSSSALTLNLPTQNGLSYTIEAAADLRGPWQAWTNQFIGSGEPLTIPMPLNANAQFFRVRVQ